VTTHKECDADATENSYNLIRISVSDSITLTLSCYVMSSTPTTAHSARDSNSDNYRYKKRMHLMSVNTFSMLYSSDIIKVDTAKDSTVHIYRD